MPKNEFTPRAELICGKLDALHEAVVAGDTLRAIDLIAAVRHDAERMEAALVRRKAEVASLDREIDLCNSIIDRERKARGE